MKRPWVLAFAIAVIFAGSLAAAPVFAQQPQADKPKAPPTLKIAIVDIPKVTRSSAMTRDIARQIDARRKSLKAEIQTEEESLRAADQELQRQRVLLAPAAYEEERKKFEGRIREMQGRVQQSNEILNLMRQAGERDFQIAMGNALVKLANDNNYTLVLRKREIMIAAEAFDITDQVIVLIDKAVPSYTIPEPQRIPGK